MKYLEKDNKMMTYEESKAALEIIKHKEKVAILMLRIAVSIITRSSSHDDSKFSEEEFPTWMKVIPKLNETEYGSEEYKQNLEKIKQVVEVHQKTNTHHPEHFPQWNKQYEPSRYNRNGL